VVNNLSVNTLFRLFKHIRFTKKKCPKLEYILVLVPRDAFSY